jgi:hypothetical protein
MLIVIYPSVATTLFSMYIVGDENQVLQPGPVNSTASEHIGFSAEKNVVSSS